LIPIDDDEQVARLLFCPQMVCADGRLNPAAFPIQELLALNNKGGASVDRCKLLTDSKVLLRQKVEEMANPAAGRNPWGYCTGKVTEIRAIRTADKGSPQVFKICPDPVVNKGYPKQWDSAHALILTFDSTHTRSQIRGFRDQLIKAFSCKVRTFTTNRRQYIQTLVRCRIPCGKVITYGDISKEVYGHHNAGQAVASAIRKVAKDDPNTFPWWRVVNKEWMPTQARTDSRERLVKEEVLFNIDGSVAQASRYQLQ